MDRRGFLGGAISGAAAFAGAQPSESRGELKTAQYAIVEMMGYKKLVGKLSQGIAGLLQLDIPVEGGFVTQMINPASIYRITLVDAATVARLAKNLDPLPTIELEIQPRQHALSYDDDLVDDGYGDD
jgi:hypothetical protein